MSERWQTVSDLRCTDCNTELGDPRDGTPCSEILGKFFIVCEYCNSTNVALAREVSEEFAFRRGDKDTTQFLLYGRCPVRDCGVRTPNPMCNEHWHRIPLKKRVRYWTDPEGRANWLRRLAHDAETPTDAGFEAKVSFEFKVDET